MSNFRLCLLFAAFACFSARLGAEVIYDNTQFILSGYGVETREYGDQVDLEGTARTLTDLTFYYYGDFVADGNETMKVRIYANEVQYDLYRNSPSRLLYESGHMPCKPGYNNRTLSNLRVKLPLDTVTITLETKGMNENESAGLLLYSPPTVGASFNEFWGRNPDGSFTPFLYSRTESSLRANAGLKLVARAEADSPLEQTNTTASISMRTATAALRLAQTFTPVNSGRLDTIDLHLDWTGLPVTLSILDTLGGVPGTNVFATQIISNAVNGHALASFYDQQIYLSAGTQYAVECRTDSLKTDNPQYTLACSPADSYPGGKLWSLKEPSGEWESASLSENQTNVDAAFSISIFPSTPPVHITSPAVSEIIPFGTTVRFTAELNLPAVSILWRVRFFDGDNQIDEVMNPPHKEPPYEILWKPANAGVHTLKVLVLDTFSRPFRTEQRTVTVLPPLPSIDRIVSLRHKDDGATSLVFDTLDTDHIRVQYSDDLEHWKDATVEVVGTGAEVVYDDDGPPKTEKHPKEARQRFYRLMIGL